jgi:hypothetical protein
MLNEYLPTSLLREEFQKRDWILQNCEHDMSWVGGNLVVPFQGGQASTVTFGSLASSSDIAQDTYTRGGISAPKEAWGSLYFDHRDLMEHGKLSEQNLLKILPDQIEQFMDYMKMVVSLSFMNGTYFAKATANGDSSGNLTVDRPERFTLKQKVSIDDGDSSPVTGYVNTINLNTGVINFVTTRGGATPVDLSGYTTAQSARCYFDGSQSNGFTSLKDCLISSANGGASTIYGVTKTASPFTQAINVDGAAVSSSNILSKIFDAFVTVKNRGKGMPDKVVMSYRNLGYVMALLESSKGVYNINQGSTKVNAYGWTEITIFGVKGALTVIGLQECDDDTIFFLDTRAIKVYSNGGFQKRRSPDGLEFFEVRNTTGYAYIVDIAFLGDLVVDRPSTCGVLVNIP